MYLLLVFQGSLRLGAAYRRAALQLGKSAGPNCLYIYCLLFASSDPGHPAGGPTGPGSVGDNSLGFPKPAGPRPETRLAGYTRKRAIDQTFPFEKKLKMNKSLRLCPALRRRRHCPGPGEAAPSGEAASLLHWKGESLWSIGRFACILPLAADAARPAWHSGWHLEFCTPGQD
jgi:hypothetical protein